MKTYSYFEHMTDEKISQEFRLEKINETRIYFPEEIKENELMGKKLC